jgi:hypothetical protein
MKLIPLSKGQFAKVDDEDFEELSQYNWSMSNGYARRRIKNKENLPYEHIVMEKQIIKTGYIPHVKVIDHINGDPLDNRRSNLRLVSPSVNSLNRKHKPNPKSGYPGVKWNPVDKSWQALIKFKREVVWFKQGKDAALLARLRAEKRAEIIQKESAFTN